MLLFSDQALLHQKQCGGARRVDVYWFFCLVYRRLSLDIKKKRRRKLEKNMVEFDPSSPKIVLNKV